MLKHRYARKKTVNIKHRLISGLIVGLLLAVATFAMAVNEEPSFSKAVAENYYWFFGGGAAGAVIGGVIIPKIFP